MKTTVITRTLGTCLGAAALLLAPHMAWAAEHEVRMKGFRFVPSELEIQAGDTVRWVNSTRIVHTVTADPSRARRADSVRLPAEAEPFDSGFMRAGKEYTHTFTEPGEYRYFCIPHEMAGMIGTVTVKP